MIFFLFSKDTFIIQICNFNNFNTKSLKYFLIQQDQIIRNKQKFGKKQFSILLILTVQSFSYRPLFPNIKEGYTKNKLQTLFTDREIYKISKSSKIKKQIQQSQFLYSFENRLISNKTKTEIYLRTRNQMQTHNKYLLFHYFYQPSKCLFYIIMSYKHPLMPKDKLSELRKIIQQKISPGQKKSFQEQFKNDVPSWESLNWQYPDYFWKDIRMKSKYGFILLIKFLTVYQKNVKIANNETYDVLSRFQNQFIKLSDEYEPKSETLKMNQDAFEQILFERINNQIKQRLKRISSQNQNSIKVKSQQKRSNTLDEKITVKQNYNQAHKNIQRIQQSLLNQIKSQPTPAGNENQEPCYKKTLFKIGLIICILSGIGLIVLLVFQVSKNSSRSTRLLTYNDKHEHKQTDKTYESEDTSISQKQSIQYITQNDTFLHQNQQVIKKEQKNNLSSSTFRDQTEFISVKPIKPLIEINSESNQNQNQENSTVDQSYDEMKTSQLLQISEEDLKSQ